MKIPLRTNGRVATVDVDPATPLLYVLRNDLKLDGPKFGCGLGQCGACTVIAGGKTIRSCVTPVSAIGTKESVTLGGSERSNVLTRSSKPSSTSRLRSAATASTE